MYTCPYHGYVQIRNNSGQTGYLSLVRYDSNTAYIMIGGTQGNFATFVYKGTRVYLTKECNIARFVRLNDITL